MFLIPVQTAVVERGFSLHRIMKYQLSNRMQVMTLDSLYMGKEFDSFDYDAATKAYSFVPLDLRNDIEDMKMRRLIKHVSNIELDLLCNGINVGENTD